MLKMKVTIQIVSDEVPWDNNVIHGFEGLDVKPEEVDNLLGYLSQLKDPQDVDKNKKEIIT
jgi:hypothetical protein